MFLSEHRHKHETELATRFIMTLSRLSSKVTVENVAKVVGVNSTVDSLAAQRSVGQEKNGYKQQNVYEVTVVTTRLIDSFNIAVPPL